MSNSRTGGSSLPIINAKKIVVIGDGPIALAVAIALKNQGIDVCIVGPRLGHYTRSGDFRDDVVTKEINRLIDPHKIEDTPSLHLKDIERQLYNIVLQLDILPIPKEFSGYIDNKTIEIRDKENHNNKTTLSADLVFDCSGTARACLNKINEARKDTFLFTTIPGNPHKTYAQVRAIMSKAASQLFGIFPNLLKFNPVVYALGMEELRNMGWKSFSLPICYSNDFPKKMLDSVDSDKIPRYKTDPILRKVNIYLQIPDGMKDPEEIKQFVKILMKILRNDPYSSSLPNLSMHHESKKMGKPMITPFEVDPLITTPGFYIGDEKIPPTLHAGDATATVPFYMGEGIIMGAERCNKLKSALVIKEGALQAIQSKEYNETLSSLLEAQRDKIVDGFSSFKEMMGEGNRCAIIHYRKAFEAYVYPSEVCFDFPSKILNDPSYIKKITHGLKILDPYFFFNKLMSLKKPLENLIVDDPVLLNNAEKFLKECAEYLKPSNDKEQKLTEEQHKTLGVITKKFVEQCGKVANLYIPTTNSIKIYKLALSVLEMNATLYAADIILLYSSLVGLQRNNITEVIELAHEVYQKYVPLLVEHHHDKLEAALKRINYHKIMALIKHAETLIKQNNESLAPTINNMIEEIEKTISTFKHPEILIKQYDVLKAKYPDYFKVDPSRSHYFTPGSYW